MKEFKIKYAITLDGERTIYEDIYDAKSEREVIYNVHYHWYGVDKIETLSVEQTNI